MVGGYYYSRLPSHSISLENGNLNNQSTTHTSNEQKKTYQLSNGKMTENFWDYHYDNVAQMYKNTGISPFKIPERNKTSKEVILDLPQPEEHSKTQENKESVDLPDEVLVQIFGHLDDLALSRVICVSSQWRRIALDPLCFPKFNLEFDPITNFKKQYPDSHVISAQDWKHFAFNFDVPDPLPEFRANLAARRRFLENLEMSKTDKREPEKPVFEVSPYLQYQFSENFTKTKHLKKEYDLLVAPEGITFRDFVEKNQKCYIDFKTVLEQYGDMPIPKGIWLIPRSIIHISKYCLSPDGDALLKSLGYPNHPPFAVMQAYTIAMKVMHNIQVFFGEFARCKESLNLKSPLIGNFTRPILVGTFDCANRILVNYTPPTVGGEPHEGVVGVRKLL